ncbi:response regulator transcription factor [Marinigracilibium pacificum]|uniref:Response regulator transcription factor n=1 Tax=Marinigracilibium pacificum TaxID=2729599 RepID=A0A848J382_9BACT|nr:response regulator transcription factor [Marinigracilibium pacificum]NMM48990.1 response regulator transcription factor [Marinigracilibium pacificum]
MKILVVEDNKDLSDNIKTYLSKEGVIVSVAESYNQSLEKLVSFDYDVVLLDLMLPDKEGFELIPYLKKTFPSTGILIMSARDGLEDKVKGLDMGADDYLPKPFNLAELSARVRALYRRRSLSGSSELKFENITIDTDNNLVSIGGSQLDLTAKELQLLVFFVVNKKKLISKNAIAEHLWGDYMEDADSFDFVYQHVKNLRKKLKDFGAEPEIKTVYGLGYRFG